MPEPEKNSEFHSENASDDFIKKQLGDLAKVQAMLEQATAEFRELIQLQKEENKADKDK